MKSSSKNILEIYSHCEIYLRIILDTFGSPEILSGLEFELSLTKDHLMTSEMIIGVLKILWNTKLNLRMCHHHPLLENLA